MNTTKEPTDDYVDLHGRPGPRSALGGEDLSDRRHRASPCSRRTATASTTASRTSQRLSRRAITMPARARFDGTEKAFVKYPAEPAGRAQGSARRSRPSPGCCWPTNGTARPLDPSSYEKGTGRLAGEGPYRLVKPQRDLEGDPAKPGRPDRSQKSKIFGDGWDFVSGHRPQRRGLRPRRLRHPDQSHARGLRGIRLEERLAAHRRQERS